MDYTEVFTEKICKKILSDCLDKCKDILDVGIVRELSIDVLKLNCIAEDTFIKIAENKNQYHVWYRWRRGAKTNCRKQINDGIKDKSLCWTHIVYIKFVKNPAKNLCAPIVVGKSNSSSSFDLVYTTKISMGKENSKRFLQSHKEWEWDVENLIVLRPNIILHDGKELEKTRKLILYRKVAYAIESYLLDILEEMNKETEIKTIYES